MSRNLCPIHSNQIFIGSSKFNSCFRFAKTSLSASATSGSCGSYHTPGLKNIIVSSPVSRITIRQVPRDRIPLLIRKMSASPCSTSSETQEIEELANTVEDLYGGVTVNIEHHMDSTDFVRKLKASMLKWMEQGKKGIWIKLPIEFSNLVEPTVKEGFKFHHAEPNYLMLVNWISNSVNTLPANASHRVGIGAFVLNDENEMLVVQEKDGSFRGEGVWKLPTGVVEEGEDISAAAIREVKEETGIDTEFVEVLAFRQSHLSFFGKSDMLFICMLKPLNFNIEKQDSEIAAAKWMSVKEYAEQPFHLKNEVFNYMAKICVKKSEGEYSGFTPVSTTTRTGKLTYVYCSTKDLLLNSTD